MINPNKYKDDVENTNSVFLLCFFCANPLSTLVLDRINRALKKCRHFWGTEKKKERKKTDDWGGWQTDASIAGEVVRRANRKWDERGGSHSDGAGGQVDARRENYGVTEISVCASWCHWPIKTCQQQWVTREWQGGSSNPSPSLSPLLQCHYLYRIPPPKSCGLGTKGTKTWLINQHRLWIFTHKSLRRSHLQSD